MDPEVFSTMDQPRFEFALEVRLRFTRVNQITQLPTGGVRSAVYVDSGEFSGPKLKGKLHIYCGDMDNYYLNDAVYLMEDFLKKTRNPFYGGEVDYGDRAEHCWNGDHVNPNYVSRLRYNTMYLPKILKHIQESAPAGTNVKLWQY